MGKVIRTPSQKKDMDTVSLGVLWKEKLALLQGKQTNKQKPIETKQNINFTFWPVKVTKYSKCRVYGRL